ncbi:hypothetical protein LINPERHAP1_LOCUS7084 [Linum perenne]
MAQTNFSVAANWPGSYERFISVRFKSRNGFSGCPTRFIVLQVKPGQERATGVSKACRSRGS